MRAMILRAVELPSKACITWKSVLFVFGFWGFFCVVFFFFFLKQ